MAILMVDQLEDSEHHRKLANARERKRMKCINIGFEHLRNHLPNSFHDKRLSKVETLKSAIEYINRLQKLIGDNADFSPQQSPNFYYSENVAFQTTVWTPPTPEKSFSHKF